MTHDTLLIAVGFSFADAHVARIDECLTANPSASVFAFQFKPLNEETFACDILTLPSGPTRPHRSARTLMPGRIGTESHKIP